VGLKTLDDAPPNCLRVFISLNCPVYTLGRFFVVSLSALLRPRSYYAPHTATKHHPVPIIAPAPKCPYIGIDSRASSERVVHSTLYDTTTILKDFQQIHYYNSKQKIVLLKMRLFFSLKITKD